MNRKEALTVAAEQEAMGRVLYGDRIAFIRDEAPDKVGLIHLPQDAAAKPIKGTVIMVGKGVYMDSEAFGVQIGDRISFQKYEPTQLEVERLDGEVVRIDVIHASSLYFGFTPRKVRKAEMVKALRKLAKEMDE